MSAAAFNQALDQYRLFTKRSLSEVINKKATSILLNAAGRAPKGNKTAIKAIPETLPWWPKMVNKILRDAGDYMLKFRRKATGANAYDVTWTDPATGKVRVGRNRMTVRRAATRSNADKKRVSRSIIRRRTATVNYMRGLFLNVAAKFDTKVRMAAVSSFRRGWGIQAAPATPAQLHATMSIPITTANRAWGFSSKWGDEARNNSAKYGMAARALDAAFRFEAESMRKYCEQKLAEAAAKHSARAA